jgi:MFS transporter, FSR family, fosmidomycin resistance protein
MPIATSPLTTTPTPTPTNDTRVIAFISTAHGLSHLYQILVPSLFAFIAADLNLSYTQLGVLLTLFFAASSVGQVAAGFAVDSFGGRNLLCGGLLLCGLAHLAAGFAPNFATLALTSFLAGVGNCVFHPADFSLMNQLVSGKKLSWAFSLHAISGNIGYVLSPIFAVAAQQVLGWHGALMLAGAIGTLLAFWLMIEPSLQYKPAASQKTQGASTQGLSVRELIEPLLNPIIFFAFAFFCVTTFYSVSISSFGPALFRDVHGLSIETGTVLLSMYLLAQTVGMMLGGYIGSTGRAPGRTASIATACAGLIGFGFFFSPLSQLALTTVLLSIGICVGVVSPSRDLLIKKVAPKQALGRAYGVVYAGFDVGACIAPLLYGYFIDHQWGLAVFGCAVASLFLNAWIAHWLDKRVGATKPGEPLPRAEA